MNEYTGPERRANPSRISKIEADVDRLHKCVDDLASSLRANSRVIAETHETVQTMRDVLGTFKVTLAIGKWIAALGAAFAAILAGMKGIRGN